MPPSTTRGTIGKGSEERTPPGPGTGPGDVELAKLGDILKLLKDEYTGASSTLSEMESVYSHCSGATELVGNGEGGSQNPTDPLNLPAAPSAAYTLRHINATIPTETPLERPILQELQVQAIS